MWYAGVRQPFALQLMLVSKTANELQSCSGWVEMRLMRILWIGIVGLK